MALSGAAAAVTGSVLALLAVGADGGGKAVSVASRSKHSVKNSCASCGVRAAHEGLSPCQRGGLAHRVRPPAVAGL